MRILAIESSCDETAAAIVDDGTTIVQNVVATSTEFHKKYGGIVPEIAAREQIKSIVPVLDDALSIKGVRGIKGVDRINGIDAIAVAVGPGLIGSLLVGVETAKTLAYVTGKPIIPVNHVLAHMYANFLATGDKGQETGKRIQFPAISLVVSGGHTELFLMTTPADLKWLGGTVDDAAGEAFDKTARLLGFENGGGPAIQRAASQCHPELLPAGRQGVSGSPSKLESGSGAGMTGGQIRLPRPLMHDKTLNFSFSGLKTAVMREWKKYHPELLPAGRQGVSGSPSKMDSGSGAGMTNHELVTAFTYEVQEAITDVLVAKTISAANQYEAKSILISGGVAANLRLREKFETAISQQLSAVSLHIPPISLCTDNAAYIASYAFFRGVPTDWHEVTAIPNLSVEV